jgi:hypothetical protein
MDHHHVRIIHLETHQPKVGMALGWAENIAMSNHLPSLASLEVSAQHFLLTTPIILRKGMPKTKPGSYTEAHGGGTAGKKLSMWRAVETRIFLAFFFCFWFFSLHVTM